MAEELNKSQKPEESDKKGNGAKQLSSSNNILEVDFKKAFSFRSV